MHAFLITGPDTKTVNQKMKEVSEKISSRQLEFSIEKIELVRELNDFLRLKEPEKTVIVIRDCDRATTEALNAFLKNLEEPQKNIKFILTARNVYKIPETILSRCQIVRTINSDKTSVNKEIDGFFEQGVGEKLKTAGTYKKRDEAEEFLKGLIKYMHQKILNGEGNYSKRSKTLKLLSVTLDNISANGNVTIQLTNLVVKLDNLTSIGDKSKV